MKSRLEIGNIMTQTAPTLRSTRVPTRSKQLADAHALAHRAGFETTGKVGDPRRARYERELNKVIGVPSLYRASRSQREAAISHFRMMVDASYRIANARPVVAYSDADCAGIL